MSTLTHFKLLNVLRVLAWIVFIALCVETGAMLVSFSITLFVTPEASVRFYKTVHLFSVLHHSTFSFVLLAGGLGLVSVLKTYLFYLLIEIFQSLNVQSPFNTTIATRISRMGYSALGIGLLMMLLAEYVKALHERGVAVPDLGAFVSGESAFLMLGSIIFVISVVFKRGIELQTENELTV